VFLLCGEKLRLPGRSGKEAVPAGNHARPGAVWRQLLHAGQYAGR
jgi:hypothetical protein